MLPSPRLKLQYYSWICFGIILLLCFFDIRSSLFHMLYMPSLELFWILENLISVKTDNFNSWYYTYIA